MVLADVLRQLQPRGDIWSAAHPKLAALYVCALFAACLVSRRVDGCTTCMLKPLRGALYVWLGMWGWVVGRDQNKSEWVDAVSCNI